MSRDWLSARRLVLATIVLIGFAANAAPLLAAEPSLAWSADPKVPQRVTIELAGLDRSNLKVLRATNWSRAEFSRVLAVYAEQGDPIADLQLPPMLGSYQVSRRGIIFVPDFPLEHSLTYRAVFRPEALPIRARSGRMQSVTLRLPPAKMTSESEVTVIYPTAHRLPENQLKFYVHFSGPMSRGHIYDHIHLRKEDGSEVELPFLQIDEELWNEAMNRLTLFIDPGRIKRGVRPLEEIGPALEEGKRYSLVIDAAWKDAAGLPLRQPFTKSFSVGPPDREPPDPARWKMDLPTSSTRNPLQVHFTDPMDHALALRMIRVLEQTGRPVPGEPTLSDSERTFQFVPAQPWRKGRFELSVQTTIEDLAGNNVGKPFEVDLFEGVEKRLSRDFVRVPFDIK